MSEQLEPDNKLAIKYIVGDLFEGVANRNRDEKTFICHVCNSMNKMASGFVVPLMRKFPVAKSQYHAWFDENFQPEIGVTYVTAMKAKLGEVQFLNVEPSLFVTNMIAQTLGGLRPLDYGALVHCMEHVLEFANQ